MAHPMVRQLRFTRKEFVRCLDGLNLQDAYVRHGRMNCISWTIGHLAAQENGYFVYLAQGLRIQTDLRAICGFGSPPSTPKLDDMWAAWREVTANADVYLDTLTTELLQSHPEHRGQPVADSVGDMLQRTIYHYWYHLGEAHAIRQVLGHRDLPQFVAPLEGDFAYAPH